VLTDKDITIQAWREGEVPKIFRPSVYESGRNSSLCTGRFYPHETEADSTLQP